MKIESSEFIINSDGSVFHLHLHPEDLADTVILVGDPGRVALIAKHFDKIEKETASREFVSSTGYIGKKRITILSTGIGTDNIDIVLNELDALANIDFETRMVKSTHKSLTILRLGTSGALHKDIPLGAILQSDISIGFDGLLNFYADSQKYRLLEMETAFMKHMDWSKDLATPYFIHSSEKLINLFGNDVIHGATISSPGFYGPQGRVLRLGLFDKDLQDKIETFKYKDVRITNFEMESSAIAGLSAMLGHQASTLCTIIANRHIHSMNTDYSGSVEKMIELALEKLITI